MEFKSFKELSKYKKKMDAPPRPLPLPPPPPPPPSPLALSWYKPRPPEEPVINGDVTREPVDRVARRVTAPAPWYFKPPAEQLGSKLELEPEPEHMKTHSKNVDFIQEDAKYQNSQPEGVKIIGGEEYYNLDQLALKIIDQINKTPHNLTPLARAAFDARKVLSDALLHVGEDMDLFKDNVARWLGEIRNSRMNFTSEANYMMGPLKDIRQFFLDSTYKEEVGRLKEFVDLCERLQKLKDSGFLDTVADTMIRLATKTETNGQEAAPIQAPAPLPLPPKEEEKSRSYSLSEMKI